MSSEDVSLSNGEGNEMPGFRDGESFEKIHGFLQGVRPVEEHGIEMVIYSYQKGSFKGLNVVPAAEFRELPEDVKTYDAEEKGYLEAEEIIGEGGYLLGTTKWIQ